MEGVEESILQAAAICGHLHVIQWLQEQGLDLFAIHPIGDDHFGALFGAAYNGHFHVVKWFHKQGFDLHHVRPDGSSVLTAAIGAGHRPMISWLCQQGLDIHRVNIRGRGALSQAIFNDHLSVAKWLLRIGVHLTKEDINVAMGNVRAYSPVRKKICTILFKMTSTIRRADLLQSLSSNQKRWLLQVLKLRCQDDASEAQIDQAFARFNQYDDQNKLVHKCLLAVAGTIRTHHPSSVAASNYVKTMQIPGTLKSELKEVLESRFYP